MKKKEEAARTGKVIRTTMETVVDVQLNIDGEGTADIDTGIGFFDHMLNLLASHGRFDLKVKADGDLEVDGHHTVEDVGIALGQAMMDAAGSKKGIARYGSFYLPMDESLAYAGVDVCGKPLTDALAFAALDISGRPYLAYQYLEADIRNVFIPCDNATFLISSALP